MEARSWKRVATYSALGGSLGFLLWYALKPKNALDPVRAEARDLIRQYDGVTCSTDPDRYVELLGPDESRETADYFCLPKTSGCGLVIRGLWRKLGVSSPTLFPPYKIGTAVSLLIDIARSRGAWISLAPAKGTKVLPSVGDMVLVGGPNPEDGGIDHVFTVTNIRTSDDGVVLESVDGGQRDSQGQQAIYAKERRWRMVDGFWYDVAARGSDPGADAVGGRRVQGFADLAKILAAEPRG